ncbi:hypothetical protein AVEN_219169-1 [Araneus ventricosus]|uniref:Uncharacterized protein n=1 Tax=Araneus ventricosus TaxID=182803 RepID=A0A4Y2FNX7_ARAVE|nr:hypothetical protein AVEN_219169-1 [Araneus ventricosus]
MHTENPTPPAILDPSVYMSKILWSSLFVCLPLAEVEINCEFGHIETKDVVVTNDPGRYVSGNKAAQLFKDKPFLNLENANAVFARSQVKRSSEEDRNKNSEVEQPEKMSHIEIDEDILPQVDEEYMEIKK